MHNQFGVCLCMPIFKLANRLTYFFKSQKILSLLRIVHHTHSIWIIIINFRLFKTTTAKNYTKRCISKLVHYAFHLLAFGTQNEMKRRRSSIEWKSVIFYSIRSVCVCVCVSVFNSSKQKKKKKKKTKWKYFLSEII